MEQSDPRGAGEPLRPPPDPTPPVSDLVRVIAVDGPAGSGKSTVAKCVAQQLGWRFVDTGASYRAVTLAVLQAGVDPADATAVAEAARQAGVRLITDPFAPRAELDGTDVTDQIRGPDVTAAVSAVSSVPGVRAVLIDLQRRAMGVDGAVVEGRDIATVVAPLAAVKVYLDARPEVRALRRSGDSDAGVKQPQGAGVNLREAVEQDLLRRDALDNQTNTLEASKGAVNIDTSDMTLDDVVAAVVRLAVAAGIATGSPGTPKADA